MLKKSIILGITTLFVSAVLLPGQAKALSLDPAIMEIDLTAGEKTVAVIELENDTTEELTLETEVVNFTAETDTGDPIFDFDATPTGIATWTEVESGPITLQPGTTEDINVTFDTPAGATAGGHYVAVFFNQTTPADEAGQVNIESKIGTLFLATVAGSYTETGKVASFSADKTNYTEGPVAFSLRYQNTGDVHLKPTGSVAITSMFGKTVKTIEVNSQKGAVLPGNIRKFDVASWQDIGNAFGKYTAKVTLTAGTAQSSATVEFWVISTMGIVIAVVIVIVLIFLIILLTKAVGRKKTDTTPTQ